MAATREPNLVRAWEVTVDGDLLYLRLEPVRGRPVELPLVPELAVHLARAMILASQPVARPA